MVGVVKYKDKRLIFIGCLAIFFTVAIYGFLYYLTYYSDFGKREFAEIAQKKLNNLVPEIEFFKLKKGRYPDSLEQLLEVNELTDFSDPVSGNGGDNYRPFNYKKIGQHYTLFSSGIDQIINTNDDIYPRVDTGHLGLIRE